jgi:hypothetical protein
MEFKLASTNTIPNAEIGIILFIKDKFNECLNSILEQTYKNYLLFVIYNSEDSKIASQLDGLQNINIYKYKYTSEGELDNKIYYDTINKVIDEILSMRTVVKYIKIIDKNIKLDINELAITINYLKSHPIMCNIYTSKNNIKIDKDNLKDIGISNIIFKSMVLYKFAPPIFDDNFKDKLYKYGGAIYPVCINNLGNKC